MSVHVKKGIGFSRETRAAYIDLAASPEYSGGILTAAREMTAPPADTTKDRNSVWAKWGNDNCLPNQMVRDIETCGILSGIIDGKARFAVCNGLLPALVHYDNKGQMVIDEIVMADEINDFLCDNNHFVNTYAWMKDLCGLNNGVAQLMLNKERNKIAAFQRADVSEMRYEKMDNNGIIKNIYLSSMWEKVRNVNNKEVKKIALLNPNNPLLDLRERVEASTTAVEFAMTFKNPAWRKKYYPPSQWYASYLWVKIAQGVPEMKAAMYENNFRPKYLVVISEKYWEQAFIGKQGEAVKNWMDYTEEERQALKNEVFDNIDLYLSGNKNAYKAMFVDGIMDPTTGKLSPLIDVIPIKDTTKDGELLPDSASANSEIAFSMLFNPAIIGASMPSGPYTNSQGGSNVREATLLQVIIHELERQHIRSIFNVIKRFNGWDKDYAKAGQRLEFIIPATIPTTLDTGSNVKPMVTGANPRPKNQEEAA